MQKNREHHWGNVFYEPAWLAALFLLLFNDHYLKYDFFFPDWLRHKLSDFAGLVVLPPVVCFLVGACKARSKYHPPASFMAAGIFGLIGVFFSLLNLLPRFSEWAVSLLAFLGISSMMWPDPTDLMALIVLPLSWRYFSAIAKKPPRRRYSFVYHRLLPLGAILICLYTAERERPEEPNPLEVESKMSLGYAGDKFRDGFAAGDGSLLFADSKRHRIVQMRWESDDKSLLFERAFLYQNSEFVWSSSDISGDHQGIGLNEPFDVAQIDGQNDVIWVLDQDGGQNRLRSFNISENQVLPPLPAPADETIEQIEASSRLVLLTKKQVSDETSFRLHFYDQNGAPITDEKPAVHDSKYTA